MHFRLIVLTFEDFNALNIHFLVIVKLFYIGGNALLEHVKQICSIEFQGNRCLALTDNNFWVHAICFPSK